MVKSLISIYLSAFSLLSCSAELSQQQPKPNKVNTSSIGEIYLSLSESSKPLNAEDQKRLNEGWQIADTPMLLETMMFTRDQKTFGLLYNLLKEKSGEAFDVDSDQWRQWIWAQKYQEHPSYAKFKGDLYKHIDPKFAAYFDNKPATTIRLDEIRWGGVIQDGIPPLRKPKMLSVKNSNYLADTDIVFGIEVNGDFRAYPKRILAWHEMFTDTIQGVPLAGVY